MALLRRGLIGWLLLALLWAPMLGQLHRHVHAPHGADATVRVAAHAGRGVSASLAEASTLRLALHAAAPQHWIASLFAAHGQAADCLLYDQCNVADTLVSTALPTVAALPVFRLCLALGEHLARWLARYDARGPPPVR